MKRVFLALFLLNSFSLFGAEAAEKKLAESSEQGIDELRENLPVAIASEPSRADLRAQLHMLQNQNATQAQKLKTAQEVHESYSYKLPGNSIRLYVRFNFSLIATIVNICENKTFGDLVNLLKKRGDIPQSASYKDLSFNLNPSDGRRYFSKSCAAYQSLKGTLSSGDLITIKYPAES